MAANATAPGVDLQQLVAEADTGGRKPSGNAGCADLCGRDRLVAVPDLVRVAFALHAGLRHLRRHRGARVPPELCAVPGVRGLSGLQVVAAQSRAADRLAAGRGGDLRGALSRRVLSRHRAASGTADAGRYHRRRRRRRAAARGVAARRRPVDADHRHRRAALCLPRALSAGADGASRLVAVARGVAFLADLRRRVRRRARRLDQLHLPVRAVRRAAGEGGRRQLFHPALVRAARQVPRRAGEGRGGVVGPDRHDLRLVGRQRRHHRHLHDPADEARRLSGGEGRRDRMRGRRQRPADAAGDGRGRVPDGRVCRHHLCRGLQARVPAGGPDLRRAVLCGRSGGREGRHERHRASARRARCSRASSRR